MKILHFLLIILLVSISSALKCNSTDVEPEQAKECNIRDKSIDNMERCCYVYQKYFLMGGLEKGKFCTPLTKIEFENIKDVIKSYKDAIEKLGGIIDTFEIDCSSNYIYISLLSLMIFLL